MNEKQPWTLPNSPWKTENSFWSYIRSGLRAGLWNKNPTKLNFIKLNRERIPNPNPKGKTDTVWGGRCVLCDNLFPQSKLEVDHKEGNHSLRSLDDVKSFVEKIAFVVYDDLQLVCKECHRCKSYSEKLGISFEEAVIEKKVIEICKMKADQINEWLTNHGYEGKMPTNQKQRRSVVKGVLEIARKEKE